MRMNSSGFVARRLLLTAAVHAAAVFGLVGNLSAAECGSFGNVYWTATTGAVSTWDLAADPFSAYWAHGSGVSRHDNGAATEIWSYDPSGGVMRRPLPFTRRDGVELVLAALEGGFTYCLDAADGQRLWSRNLDRVTCSADGILAPPAIQLWRGSNAAFQAAFSNDLVLVGTELGCGTTLGNRVSAINATDGAIRWTFNSTQAYQTNRITGLTIDYARNRVYAVTDSVPGGSVNTVIAISTLNGARVWGAPYGGVAVAGVLHGDYLYVLNKAGMMRKLDVTNSLAVWEIQVLDGLAQCIDQIALQPGAAGNYLYFSSTAGNLYYVRDDGSTATLLGSTNLGGRLASSAPVVASGLERLYVGTRHSPGLAQLDLCSPASFIVGTDALAGTTKKLAINLSVPGTPKLFAATDQHQLTRYCIPWGSNPSCSISPPAITVQAPNGGEILFLGSNVDIHWAPGSFEAMPIVDILLSRAGFAGPFEVIASNIANSGSYSWTIAGATTENAMIRVVGHRADLSVAGGDDSDAPIAIRVLTNTIDDGLLVAPQSVAVAVDSTSDAITGRVFKAGITEAAGAAAGVVAQLGYGPDGSDPSSGGSWTWGTATYNGQTGAYDEYSATLTVPTAGTYDYAYRFAFNGGPWLYGDLDGSANGYSPAQAGDLTVTIPTTDVGRGPGVRTAIQRISPIPMRHSATVAFSLESAAHFLLTIHAVAGQRVRTLLDAEMPAGPHSIEWDGSDDRGRKIPPGIYLVRLSANGVLDQRRIAVVSR